MELHRRIQPIVVVLAFDETPDTDLKFLFDAARFRGLGNIREGSLDCAILVACDGESGAFQHRKGDQKGLGLGGNRIEGDQLPCVQRVGPSFRRLRQFRRMWETGVWFFLPPLARHENPFHPVGSGGSKTVQPRGAKLVESLPCLLLATVQ